MFFEVVKISFFRILETNLIPIVFGKFFNELLDCGLIVLLNVQIAVFGNRPFGLSNGIVILKP
jgi:hypothetical protein